MGCKRLHKCLVFQFIWFAQKFFEVWRLNMRKLKKFPIIPWTLNKKAKGKLDFLNLSFKTIKNFIRFAQVIIFYFFIFITSFGELKWIHSLWSSNAFPLTLVQCAITIAVALTAEVPHLDAPIFTLVVVPHLWIGIPITMPCAFNSFVLAV